MNAIDVLMWIVTGGAILLVLVLFVWSLCEVSRISDECSEEQWKEYMDRENRQKEAAKKENEERKRNKV